MNDHFYADLISSKEKLIYTALLKAVQNVNGLCVNVGEDVSNEEVQNAYDAAMFDYPELPWFDHGALRYQCNEGIVSFSLIENAHQPMKIDASAIGHIVENFEHLRSDPRRFLTAVCRWLRESSLYYTKNAQAADSQNILTTHYGNCIACARLVKIIADKAAIPVICVRGKIRNYASGVVFSDNPFADIPHAWNAFKSNSGWLFFDATSCIGHANETDVKMIHDGFFKKNYATDDFVAPSFFAPSSPEWHKTYIIQDKEVFLNAKE